MKLESFGKTLRALRKALGLTQVELAELIGVTSGLISIWERAYNHDGRAWKPDRDSVVRLVKIFADQLTPEVAQHWVSQADYQLGRQELQMLFPAQSKERPRLQLLSNSKSRTNRAPLNLPTAQRLFGVEPAKQRLYDILDRPVPPWLVAIDGIGGIGKTSLAAAIVREFMTSDRFYGIAWISAKQEEFLPGGGLGMVDKPALDADTLVDALLEQLGDDISLARSTAEKIALLTDLLKQHPYLVVIDNLETVRDYEALLPLLRNLMQPTKFLMTSRNSLREYPDFFCYSIDELNQTDTIAFLHYEADLRGSTALVDAPRAQLARIHKVVGGNPLALKLVIGQLSIFSLSQILENLMAARGKKIDQLYTYIYWQAWQTLEPASQQALLAMPLAQRGTFNQLAILSELDLDDLNEALDQLVALSLIQVIGDLDERRYYIHRLTETFLLNEVVKWQSSL